MALKVLLLFIDFSPTGKVVYKIDLEVGLESWGSTEVGGVLKIDLEVIDLKVDLKSLRLVNLTEF